jgi:hypothetical protein
LTSARGRRLFSLDNRGATGESRGCGHARQETHVDHRRPELTKRQKELARQRRQQEKADRRSQRQRERDQRPAGAEGGDEDPDIAGIVPGPQPPSEE